MSKRTPEEILNDIKSLPEELADLHLKYGKQTVKHPNIGQDVFKLLADFFPLEATENPALPLWELEDPCFWSDLKERFAEKWINRLLESMDSRSLKQFAAICLLSCLFPFEDAFPAEAPIVRMILNNISSEEDELSIMPDIYELRDILWASKKEADNQASRGVIATRLHEILATFTKEILGGEFVKERARSLLRTLRGRYGYRLESKEAVLQWDLLVDLMKRNKSNEEV